MTLRRFGKLALAVAAGMGSVLSSAVAFAGPPYVSDDPETTDDGHYEIYAYTDGTATREGTAGEAGIDFNYGAGPNLQLTAVVPLGYENPAEAPGSAGLGNVELAVKYRFLRQDEFGVDLSVFPRVLLPSGTRDAGTDHAAFSLPIWAEKDWGKWSGFGGGGCELNRAGPSRNFCQAGGVLARRILPDLQIGVELTHQTPDAKGGTATGSIGAGIVYDANEHYHLMAYAGRGIQNADDNDRCSWYAAVQFTF